MVIHTDYKKLYNVESKNIKGLFLVSGVYDLRPLTKTTVNDNLKLSEIEAAEFSPLLRDECFLSSKSLKEIIVYLSYGEFESNEFKAQSKNYTEVMIFLFRDLNFLKLILSFFKSALRRISILRM